MRKVSGTDMDPTGFLVAEQPLCIFDEFFDPKTNKKPKKAWFKQRPAIYIIYTKKMPYGLESGVSELCYYDEDIFQRLKTCSLDYLGAIENRVGELRFQIFGRKIKQIQTFKEWILEEFDDIDEWFEITGEELYGENYPLFAKSNIYRFLKTTAYSKEKIEKPKAPPPPPQRRQTHGLM